MSIEARPRQRSIYLGDSVHQVLSAVQTRNRSARLNTVCERYLLMIADEMPEFTLSEWVAIITANKFSPPTSLAYANVWESGHANLANRLRQMPLTARLAVAEAIDRYWGQEHRMHDKDKARALESIGARIKGRREKELRELA